MKRPVWHQFTEAKANGAKGRAGIGYAECFCEVCNLRFSYVAEGVITPDELVRA